MKGVEIGISTASLFKKQYNEDAIPTLDALDARVCEVFLESYYEYYTEDGKVLYDVITANNKYVEAKCSFLDENNNISQKEVPTILLEAVNNGCATLGEQLKTHCSISLSSELETCNLNWLKENEENLKNPH